MNCSRLLHMVPFGKTLILCLGLLLPLASGSTLAPEATTDQSMVPAFPGAQGGGKYTSGGRGGKVIKVSNLHDSGPGSLRQAIETPGARTIVFEISGTIELESRLLVEHGNLTIAGQTAPGDGICIKGHEFRINASNIIIRYVRFRPGDIAGQEYDAITGMRNHNIIIDHCSFSWSTDETVSLYDNENLTLQWSIISESLNNSVHSKGEHGYGGIWGGKNASFLNNILAHHNSRNPRLQGTRYQRIPEMEKTELVNNIIYNWGNKAMYGGENGRYNIVGNVFIPGPATRPNVQQEILEPYMPFGKYFLKGNVFYIQGQTTLAGWEHVGVSSDQKDIIRAYEPFPFHNHSVHTDAMQAYEQVLLLAGASRFRDEVDTRIVSEVRSQTYTFGRGGIIDSQQQVGGWPVLRSLPAPLDSDGDGIPDEWELQHGLNPFNPDDASEFSLDTQYTNLEIYLNSIITN